MSKELLMTGENCRVLGVVLGALGDMGEVGVGILLCPEAFIGDGDLDSQGEVIGLLLNMAGMLLFGVVDLCHLFFGMVASFGIYII